ncbi:MAG: hypothetical protein FWF61_06970 [Brevinematales bacterium]|nr:hypothetical protein [Brevinematales bacterium]
MRNAKCVEVSLAMKLHDRMFYHGITAFCISDHWPIRPRSFCHERAM